MLLIGREGGKGQIGKMPGPSPSKSGKSRKNRESPKKDKKALTLQSLLFSISLIFSFSDFPCFSCVFPSFSKDFRGSAKRETLAFLGKNPCFFQKSKGWRVREDKEGRTSPDRETPRLKHPRLAALELGNHVRMLDSFTPFAGIHSSNLTRIVASKL